MRDRSIGLLELSSVAAGFQALDAMLKTAETNVLLSRTICSGKYLILLGGDVASVEAALAVGTRVTPFAVIDHQVIARVHESVFPAIAGQILPAMGSAFGCIETFSAVTGIKAADAAAKAAAVELLELRLAMALGGKAYCTLTGDVGAVEAAVEAGKAAAAAEGLLVNAVVITGPHRALLREVV